MGVYQSKIKKLSGSKYSEVYPKALFLYKRIASTTKRRPYVRSIFFKKEKIFLDYFWQHLREKNVNDKIRRLAFYSCALDLIRNCRNMPVTKINPNKKSEILHRFTGSNSSNERFCVQIKEDIKRGQKYFLSVFPFDKQ